MGLCDINSISSTSDDFCTIRLVNVFHSQQVHLEPFQCLPKKRTQQAWLYFGRDDGGDLRARLGDDSSLRHCDAGSADR